MSFRARTFLAILGICLLASFSRAVTQDNPYHTIVDRNPFGLNPPPPPSTNNTVEPPKNVKFNGITNVGGRKKAFFTIPGKDQKEPAQYLSLSEGERSDVLEVSKIFEAEGEVEVINSGIKMVLNFKNNGNKGATLAPQPGAPPIPNAIVPPVPTAVPNAAHPNPNAASPVYNPNMGNPAVAQPIGLENPGFQPNQGAVPNPNVNPAGQPIQNAPPPPEGLRQIPTRTLRLNPVNAP